jgi:putative protein-disulfide isomerase
MSRVRVVQFTDPYSTWCWGSEPVLRRLREVYRDQLTVEHVMGGLVEDFAEFHDPTADIQQVTEVAAHWTTAAQRHGMPVDTSLWEDDPPSSTYPACRAYEAATLTAPDRAAAFLRRLREAGACEARNLEREATLADLAADVGIDPDALLDAFGSDAAREAFEADLERTHEAGATALPTFRLEVDGAVETVRGYSPFVTFEKALTQAAPDLTEHDPRPLSTFVAAHGRVAPREVAEVYGHGTEEAATELDALVADGELTREPAGNGTLYESA